MQPEETKPITAEKHRVLRAIGAIALSLLLVLNTVFTTALFALNSAVTSDNVENLILGSDLFTTLLTSSAGVNDPDSIAALTSIAEDPTVKTAVADYLGDVVGDIRSGSDSATLDTSAICAAAKPYTLPLVKSTFVNGLRDDPNVEDFFQGYAAQQLTFTLNKSMGDWQSLLAQQGIGQSQIAQIRFALSTPARVLGVCLTVIIGILLVALLRRHRQRGFMIWGAISLILGAVFWYMGATGAYVDVTTLTTYQALLAPLNGAMAVCGIVEVVAGVGLIVCYLCLRKHDAPKVDAR